MPLDGNMALLQKALDRDGISWLNDTSATSLDPVALGAGVSLPVNCFENEWLESSFVLCLVHLFFPVFFVPPELIVRDHVAVFLQNVVGHCPHLLVNSPPSWLEG